MGSCEREKVSVAARVCERGSSPTFCESAVAKVNDGMLADSVTYYGHRATRVSPLIGLVEDWSDHYSQLAGYLRLNNVLPPTAKNGET